GDGDGVGAHLVLTDLDGAEDAALDGDLCLRVGQLQAGLRWTERFAVRPERPPGYQGAVPHGQLRDRTFAADAATSDQEAVQGEAAARRPRHGEGIGSRRLPVHQAQHGPRAIGCPQLQALPLAQLDHDLLQVDAAVGDLDHRVLWLLLPPESEGVADAHDLLVL